MVTVAAVAVSTLVACVPFGIGIGDLEPELRLYDGPIPAPAPLSLDGSLGGMPPQPTPPEDYTDSEAIKRYEEEMDAWIEELENNPPDPDSMVDFGEQLLDLTDATKRSDEASVAAWQSLLVASGVAVGYGPLTVSVADDEGLGIPMTSGELRLHALLGAAEGSMSLPQLADLIGGYGIFDEDGLLEALYNDITGGASDFHMILTMLEPDSFEKVDVLGTYHLREPEEVLLTGGQVGLVLRKLSAELMIYAEQAGALDDAPINNLAGDLTPHLLSGGGHGLGLPMSVPLPAAAGDGPCGTDESGWDAERRKNGAKAYNEWVFSDVIGKVFPGALGTIVKAGIAGANLASALAKFFLLEADFSMNGSPLVRTKNREPGDKKDVTVRMSWKKMAGEDARNCLAALLGPFGINLLDQASGDAGGIDVNFKLKGDRLWLDTSSGASTLNYLQQTGEDGVTVFPVVGKPQNDVLPEGAEPEDVSSRAEVAANIQGSNLVKDLISVGWDYISPGLAGIMINILSRMKLLEFTWDVPLRDWTLEGLFDVTVTGEIFAHRGENATGRSQAECGGRWNIDQSTTATGTMTSTEPHRVWAEYISASAEGQTVSGILFRTDGMRLDEIMIDPHNGGELAHLPIALNLNQLMSEPGMDPMPGKYTAPGISGCGDGDGSGLPKIDCGTRDFLGIATINSYFNVVHITSGGDPIGDKWSHCGSLWPRDPASPPATLNNCPSAQLDGGLIPPADVVFSSRGSFQITGSTECFREQTGTLIQLTVNWTLDFCRIKDGERAC